MNAMLIIATKNGYAVAPYQGEIPADFVQDMRIATSISEQSYSLRRGPAVSELLEEHFEREEVPESITDVTPLKVAA